MFFVHTILGRRGPLSTVWLACHMPHRVTKKQVMETNITEVTTLILGNDQIKCSLRILGDLLIGVMELNKRRVDYIHELLKRKLNELDKMITVASESDGRRRRQSTTSADLSVNRHEAAEETFPPILEWEDLELNLPEGFFEPTREQLINQARVYDRITLKEPPPPVRPLLPGQQIDENGEIIIDTNVYPHPDLDTDAYFEAFTREQAERAERAEREAARESAAAASAAAGGNDTGANVFDGFDSLSPPGMDLGDQFGDQGQPPPPTPVRQDEVPVAPEFQLVLEPMSEEEIGGAYRPRFIPPPRPRPLRREDGPPPIRRRRFDHLAIDEETQIGHSEMRTRMNLADLPQNVPALLPEYQIEEVFGSAGVYPMARTLEAFHNHVLEVASGRLNVPLELDVASLPGTSIRLPPSPHPSVHSSIHPGDDQDQPFQGQDGFDDDDFFGDQIPPLPEGDDQVFHPPGGTPPTETFPQGPRPEATVDRNDEQLENEVNEMLDRSMAEMPRGVARTFSALVGPNPTPMTAALVFSSLLGMAHDGTVLLSQERNINFSQFFEINIERPEEVSPEL